MSGSVPAVHGAGGRGGGPKLIRSGKNWRVVQHARAPDGGPADLMASASAAGPLGFKLC